MKKRVIAAALVLALALSGAAYASGDSLVTLSYLTGTYQTQLAGALKEAVAAAAKPVYDAAVQRARSMYGASPSGTAGASWKSADSFTAWEGGAGDTVTLALGSGLLWLSGEAQVTGGRLVDLTAGTETAAGGTLTAGRRYLAAEQTVVSLTSRGGRWMAEGLWDTTSSGMAGKQLPFTDISEESWYYDAVLYAVEHGLFNGMSETEFAPDASMERGMVTTVLHRMHGSPAVSYEPMFSDVPEGSWFTDGIIWAGSSGVVNGMGNGVFEPAGKVSRQQLAVILYRYAQYLGKDVSASGSLDRFSDQGSVAVWAQDAMSWAVGAGLLQGDAAGTVRPEASATRAEVAALLQRFQGWLNG